MVTLSMPTTFLVSGCEMKKRGEDMDFLEDVTLVKRPRLQENSGSETEESVPFDIGRNCPYLDTIHRELLDFDFEKVCSVTLININVYACLVCGKYFQGRGRNSVAYFHALQEHHHIFIHLRSLKVYCLPEDYEIHDSSLNDVRAVLKPTFTPDQIEVLDEKSLVNVDLSGKRYVPGFLGLNNIKANDYANVVVHALVHVPSLRNFLLDEKSYADRAAASSLLSAFGELARKMWNPKVYKAHVSPHELMQAIATASDKKFVQTRSSDPMEFMTWFLNRLHLDLGGSLKKSGTSIIHQTFQGEVQLRTKRIKPKKESEDHHLDQESRIKFEELEDTVKKIPFLHLTLELPPPPLFINELERAAIPQVALMDLLHKFDGQSAQVRFWQELSIRMDV
jgi:U4/U6.U5 tri-snRNP-associated protein 2